MMVSIVATILTFLFVRNPRSKSDLDIEFEMQQIAKCFIDSDSPQFDNKLAIVLHSMKIVDKRSKPFHAKEITLAIRRGARWVTGSLMEPIIWKWSVQDSLREGVVFTNKAHCDTVIILDWIQYHTETDKSLKEERSAEFSLINYFNVAPGEYKICDKVRIKASDFNDNVFLKEIDFDSLVWDERMFLVHKSPPFYKR
jgi:hypothetical protein